MKIIILFFTLLSSFFSHSQMAPVSSLENGVYKYPNKSINDSDSTTSVFGKSNAIIAPTKTDRLAPFTESNGFIAQLGFAGWHSRAESWLIDSYQSRSNSEKRYEKNSCYSQDSSSYWKQVCSFKVYTYREATSSKPGKWYWTTSIADNKAAAWADSVVPTCPPEDPNDILFSIYASYEDPSVLYCLDENTIKERDTCPESSQNKDFLQPVDASVSSPSTSMCLQKEDDSMCGYSLSQDKKYYLSDSEIDCYVSNGIPRFDPDEFEPPQSNQCEDIGNGTTACKENPINVCDNEGNCQESCGTVMFNGITEFLCLSGDNDGDGVGDYADPDIDGDGIRNDDDLDADGDGIEESDYSNVPGGGTGASSSDSDETNITVDNDGVIDAITGTNSLLSATNELLSETQGILTRSYNGPEASTLNTKSDVIIDNAIEDLENTGEDQITDMGGRVIESGDQQFIDTFIGSLPAGQCSNPDFNGHTIDLCSKAQKFNDWLYWIFAVLATIGIWHELHSTLRRQ
jgi:hypothetical protein